MVEAAAEAVDVEVAFENAAMAERDVAGFLRDKDGNGVRLLGDADAGSVAQPETAVEVFTRGERKDACCGGHAVVLHDDTTIVQHRFRVKDGQDELLGKHGVHVDAGRGKLADADVALEGDERAELSPGQVENGVDQLVD